MSVTPVLPVLITKVSSNSSDPAGVSDAKPAMVAASQTLRPKLYDPAVAERLGEPSQMPLPSSTSAPLPSFSVGGGGPEMAHPILRVPPTNQLVSYEPNASFKASSFHLGDNLLFVRVNLSGGASYRFDSKGALEESLALLSHKPGRESDAASLQALLNRWDELTQPPMVPYRT